jgi:predicted nuclease of predicted toxin-antitoxin system
VRFLADESCDFGVVPILRASGHDVLAVSEISPRLSDEDVALWARREVRVLLTEDKDFGQLAFASGDPSRSVMLIRFPAGTRTALPPPVLEIVNRLGEQLSGSSTVIQPGRVRIGRGPGEEHSVAKTVRSGSERRHSYWVYCPVDVD